MIKYNDNSINIGYVVQAKDKAHWQKLFSHFCSRTANEEEEIAHKLLGEQFKVSYHRVISWKYEIVQRQYPPLTVSSSQVGKQSRSVLRSPNTFSLPAENSCAHVIRWRNLIYFTLFLKGQLALLHSHFTEALYDDHLSRVSVSQM